MCPRQEHDVCLLRVLLPAWSVAHLAPHSNLAFLFVAIWVVGISAVCSAARARRRVRCWCVFSAVAAVPAV